MKLALVAVLALSASTAFGQKFGRVDLAAIVPNMPEYKEALTNLEAYGMDLQNQLEQIQVEFNTLLANYEKNAATMSDSIRQLKEQELSQLQQRFQDFQQVAQQDIQKKQSELLAPIFEKVKNTINEVAKAGGYSVILPGTALIYADETQVKDISKDVATKLGVDWDKVEAEAKAAAATPAQ